MFMIWDSSHEDLQLFDWVSNTASYGFISFYVNPPSDSYDKSFCEIWPPKSKVKVTAEGHVIGITSNRLISLSFHDGPPIPEMQLHVFKKLTLKIQGQAWGHFKVTKWVQHPIESHPFGSCQSFPFPRYSIFKIWPWKFKVIAQGHKVG